MFMFAISWKDAPIQASFYTAPLNNRYKMNNQEKKLSKN